MEYSRDTLNKIFAAIRKSFQQSDIFKEVLLASLAPAKGPRGGARYTCSECKGAFELKQCEIHHIIPVVPLNKRWYEMTIQEYHDRVMTNPATCLCKVCHKKITKEQRKQRR